MSMPARAVTPLVNPIDLDAVRAQYRAAQPFPFFKIDNFLREDFAQAVLDAYPTYDEARRIGLEFDAVNEKLKVQVTDQAKFPDPVKRLADILSGPEFLKDLEHITGIPRLLADPSFNGGGMHLTGPTGRLDVHVDFNLLGAGSTLHRRLNILVYLNKTWDDAWGGQIELWDKEVKNCRHSFAPIFNRCVVFETSDISFHGVKQITCPPGLVRRSFAAYYYTREAPSKWDGSAHSTKFKARPDEKVRGTILMPAEKLRYHVFLRLRKAKEAIKKFVGR